jgi:hypothetical protein
MKTIVLALALWCGCLVLPRTTTTAHMVGHQTLDPELGPVRSIELAAGSKDGFVAVRAIALHACTRRVMNVYEVRREKSLRLWSAYDARAKVLGFFLAPVAIPVSALVSGLVELGGDDVTRVSSLAEVEHFDCPGPAMHQELVIDLPSGAHATAKTDDDGKLMFEIPPTEPSDGAITVHAGDVTRSVEYQRPKPAPVVPSSIQPGSVCVAIDRTADALTESERADARREFARVLEAQHQHVVDAGCAATIELWHERQGENVIAHVRAAARRVRMTAHGTDELPATYAAIARTVIEHSEPPSAAPPEPSTTVESKSDEPARPPIRMWYGSAGYGAIASGGGVGLSVGHRRRYGGVAVDLDGTFFSGASTVAGAIRGEILLYTGSDERSWYLGGGLGLGGFSSDMESGSGGQYDLTTGYEFGSPSGDFRAFVQLDISRPTYQISTEYGPTSAPSTVMFSVGVGK